MHYSMHRLRASVTYVITLTYGSTNDKWVRSCSLVNSSETKRVSSVPFSSVQFRRSLTFRPLRRSCVSCVRCVVRRVARTET